jgi:hypothetical protein
MNRVVAVRVFGVLACGFTLTACTSWMPSWDISMPSLGGGGAAAPASLAVESDPPGAQASASGATCVTPCRLALAGTGPFTVNVALNGYVPQSVPVRVMQPDDPRLGSEDPGSTVRLDPNPVYVELERAPPAPAAPAHKKKPKHAPTASRGAPATTASTQPAPAAASAPTTAVAPAAAAPPPPAAQPGTANNSAAWPMPR